MVSRLPRRWRERGSPTITLVLIALVLWALLAMAAQVVFRLVQ